MARWRMAAGNDARRHPRVGIIGCVRDQGLAIVKGVLEQHEVAALRADLLALLDPKGEAPAAVTRTLYAFVEHSPAAAALLRNQRFMGIHRAICGADETSGLTLPPDQTRRNVMVPPFTPQNANGCHRNRALTPQALE